MTGIAESPSNTSPKNRATREERNDEDGEKEEPQLEMVDIGGELLVQKEVITMRFDCDFAHCTTECCMHGCWIRPDEKFRIVKDIKEIVPYLEGRPDLPFWKKTRGKWSFTERKMDDSEYHTMVIDERCVFVMPNGGCAIHKFCLDHDIAWEEYKFNICVTWPLDIQKWETDAGETKWHIWLFGELDWEEWDDCPCIRLQKLTQEKQNEVPLAIESMRSTIISRIGAQLYDQLIDFALEYNADLGN